MLDCIEVTNHEGGMKKLLLALLVGTLLVGCGDEDTASNPTSAETEKPAPSSVPPENGVGTMSFQEIVDEIKHQEALKVGKYKLSAISETLLQELASNVHVEVFLSPHESFPDSLLAKREELLSLLGQMQGAARGALRLNVHVLESSDPLAEIARKLGIVNKTEEQFYVSHEGHDVEWRRDLYFGTAALGGSREKVIIPFYDSGMRVEYELIRSILAASGPTHKKKIGVFSTDAPVMGSAPTGMLGFNMYGGTPAWDFIMELRKHYDVEGIENGQVRKGDYDALLVVQPSTLDQENLERLMVAIKSGIPTAIFEDPLPFIAPITGTYDPRRPGQSGAPGQPPSTPLKCDLSKLWKLLGVHFNFTPEERLRALIKELDELEGKAKIAWQPIMGFKPVQEVLKKLDEKQADLGNLEKKLKQGEPIKASEWESTTTLDSLLEPVRNLTQKDQLYQIKLIVEQSFVRETENQLEGLEQRVLWDTYNPFPKIPKADDRNFPDEFVYAEGRDEGRDGEGFSSLKEIVLLTASGSLFSSGDPDRDFTPLLWTHGSEKAGTTSLADFWQIGPMGQRIGINPDRTKYDGNKARFVVAASITGNEQGVVDAHPLQVALVADVDALADTFFRINSSASANFPLEVDNVDFILNLMDDVAGGSPLSALRKRRSNKVFITSSLDTEISLLEKQAEDDVQEEKRILRKQVELVEDDRRKLLAKWSETVARPNISNLAQRQLGELQKAELGQLESQVDRLQERSEAKIASIQRRKENLTSQLKSGPFSGWVKIKDLNGRLREQRHYLGGLPDGQWARFDEKGVETFRQTYRSPNTRASRVNLASIRKAEQDRREKQQPEVKRLQELFFTTKSGEPIFAGLTVTKIAEIEIVESVEGETKTIRLSEDAGGWFIHYDDSRYPVDATNQLGSVADGLANLKIHRLETEQEKDHAKFGVLDPSVPEEVVKAESEEDKIGKLLIINGLDASPLAELILGNKRESGSADYRYIRIPGDSIVYSAKFSDHIYDKASTQFAQWVEKDFLDLDHNQVKRVHLDNYKTVQKKVQVPNMPQGFQMARPEQQPGTKHTFVYTDGNWTSPNVKLAETESLNEKVLDEMKESFDDFEIIDVEKKPNGVIKDVLAQLWQSQQEKNQQAFQTHRNKLAEISNSLEAKGFHLQVEQTETGLQETILANNGESKVGMKNGVEYHLRFGKIYRGQEVLQKDGKDARYLLAEARVNVDLLTPLALESVPPPLAKPSPPVDADGTEAYQKEVTERNSAIASAKGRNARKHHEWEDRVSKAQARVGKLNERLSQWYFVISDDAYSRIMLKRSRFVVGKNGNAANRPEKVKASHLLVAYKGAARADPSIKRSKEDAKARAEDLRKKIVEEGQDFASVARENSDGPSKTKGGDLGSFTFHTMAKPFSEAAFALEVGAVSEVVETVFGFHVIRRTE